MDRRILWASATLCILAAAPAVAAPKSPWASRPTSADGAAARAAHVQPHDGPGGRAVMKCAVDDDGAMSGCRVVRETPVAAGYGAALLSLAPKFRREPPGKRDLREINIVWDWFRIDTPPDWIRRPTPGDLKAVLPKKALEQGIDGRAIVSCVVTVQGSLTDCLPVEEHPAGIGFGDAAVALTPQLLMKPARLAGAPTPSTVNIPINWSGWGPASAAYTGGRKVVRPDLPWATAPSYAEVVAAYPAKAREAKVGGRATVACDLSQEGRLVRCESISAEPKGYGFEAAAKSLTKLFALPVETPEDRKAMQSVSVHMPVVFAPSMLAESKPVIGKPIWARLPEGEALDKAFANINATEPVRVMMGCTVAAGGALEGCKVESETPAGAGVGAAALGLAQAFRVTPWTAEGLPVIGGSIRIPLRYQARADEAAK
ncbi:MAG: energy transducer TonB [Pseudomonadota bacterium]